MSPWAVCKMPARAPVCGQVAWISKLNTEHYCRASDNCLRHYAPFVSAQIFKKALNRGWISLSKPSLK